MKLRTNFSIFNLRVIIIFASLVGVFQQNSLVKAITVKVKVKKRSKKHQQDNVMQQEKPLPETHSRAKVVLGEHTYHFPPFYEAMVCCSSDKATLRRINKKHKFMAFAKKQYDEHILDNMKLSEEPRIPKIIHQIWIGPKQPPKNFIKWRDTWLKAHPGWEYILWDEEKISQLDLVNSEFIEQETNYAAKSDLIRYEIIYQFGGLYIDIDFECRNKPLDFLHHCSDFYCSFLELKRFHGRVRMANGILAASKNHPIVGALIQEAKNYRDKKNILDRVGPDYFKNIVVKNLSSTEGVNVVLPSNYFFSWGKKGLRIQPETLGVHHYAGSWHGQKRILHDLDVKSFGGWSIEKELFDFVLDIISEGSTILELGSGWTSAQFSKFFTVYSIEHDRKWVNKYNSNYIYAPIKNGWYNCGVLKEKLPKTYDLILVDGPPGVIGRGKFYDNLHLFNTDVPIIFDDVNRKAELTLMKKVAKKLGRPYEIFNTSSHKKFGVVLPND